MSDLVWKQMEQVVKETQLLTQETHNLKVHLDLKFVGISNWMTTAQRAIQDQQNTINQLTQLLVLTEAAVARLESEIKSIKQGQVV